MFYTKKEFGKWKSLFFVSVRYLNKVIKGKSRFSLVKSPTDIYRAVKMITNQAATPLLEFLRVYQLNE